MFSGWLKFAGILALFMVGGAYFGIALLPMGLVGGAVGAVVAGLDWYQRKTKIYTRSLLASKPFNGKLPQELGMSTTTAVALAGDDSYSQRVQDCTKFSANFEDLLDYAEYADGEVLEVQCALVVEPANPSSRHAVAVTCGGVILGYISDFESESLYNFLLQNRGMARVNSNVHFRCADQSSWVELDLLRPYRVVSGV
jgi:hypothetical protein